MWLNIKAVRINVNICFVKYCIYIQSGNQNSRKLNITAVYALVYTDTLQGYKPHPILIFFYHLIGSNIKHTSISKVVLI